MSSAVSEQTEMKTTGWETAVSYLPKILIGLALLAFCFKDRDFRASGHNILGGLGVGAVVVGATTATLVYALGTERSAGTGDIAPGQVAGPLRF